MKRRWFQIHLSTAVVLMFGAGVLLWANTRAHSLPETPINVNGGVGFEKIERILNAPERGWPFVATHWERQVLLPMPGVCYGGEEPSRVVVQWQIKQLLANIGVALSVLVLLAVFCEWRVRRAR